MKREQTWTWILAGVALAGLAACGTDVEEQAEGSAITSGQVAGQTYVDPTTSAASFYDDDPPVEVRINHNGAAITDKLLPELAEQFGLSDLDLSDQNLVTDTPPGVVSALIACHSSSARFFIDVENVHVAAPISAGDVDLIFDSDKVVRGLLDLPRFSADLDLVFTYPRDVFGWYCDSVGSDHRIAVTVHISGASGEVDLSLENASSGGVSVKSIDEFSLALDSVSFDSSFLTAITNLGLSVADLFGSGCGSLTSCVNQAISDNLSGRSPIKNALRDAIESGLAQAGTLEGGVNLGVAVLDYSVGLSALANNDAKDRMRLKWDVDVSSDRADASCAAGLMRSHYVAPGDLGTSNDLEILVPYKKLTDVLYTVAKQGDVCSTFSYTSGGQTMNLVVKPNGAFRIDSVSSNTFSLSLPIAVTGTVLTNITGSMTGTMVVTAALTPVCGGGLQLATQSVQLQNMTGTLTYQPSKGTRITFDASTFIAQKKGAAERAILNALSPGLTVVPKSFGMSAVSQYVSIGHIVHDDAGITLGLNLLSTDPYCD
ncbi:MAG: hypothetical protein U1E65_29565 [Myxococcota bacterium]